MKILVTGRSGQLARSLAERSMGYPALSVTFASRPELDLQNSTGIGRAIAAAAPEIIVNAAAFTAVDQAEKDVAIADRVNARAPGEIAEAAAIVGARLIHVSTDYVFDGRSPAPYREEDPVAPINVYGRTKAAGEAAVRAALPEHVIVRTSWVYSPFGRNFVKTMLALAETRDRLTVVDDQVGCPTSALDIADAILGIAGACAKGEARGFGATYHFAGSGSASWAEFARHLLQVSGQEGGPTAEVIGIPSEQWPTAAERPRNSRLDSSQFEAVFGYAAPHWKVSSALVVRRLVQEMRGDR